MEQKRIGLNDLGWNEWFEQRANCDAADMVARVATVDRDQLLLIDHQGNFRAKLAGSFLFHHQLASEYPCVGDWVCVEKHSGDDYAVIHSLIERRTSLRRKSAGDAIEYQMVAANIDVVFIVQSCHVDFNLKRLERYLVMVRDGGAEPNILLTKTDLIEPAIVDSILSTIRSAGITCPIVTISNITQEGIDDLRQLLQPTKTYCFVGSSGVGKSTLINTLIGSASLETRDVSGTGEGRHTTVRRELLVLNGGALVIDTPGMREFGILGADSGIDESFSDITRFATHCRYRDCTHTNEPRCAVIAAVKSGEISQEHYENYLKLKEESAFYEMSYAERRKKDHDLGKFFKSAKKQLKNRKDNS